MDDLTLVERLRLIAFGLALDGAPGWTVATIYTAAGITQDATQDADGRAMKGNDGGGTIVCDGGSRGLPEKP